MVLKLYSIITCSLLSLQVSAWTQSQGFFGHRIVTTLRLRSEEDEQVDMERSRLERLFTDFKDDFDEHFLPAENKLNQMVNLPVHGWVESATTDDMYDWSDVCYGEECDVSNVVKYSIDL